MNDLRREQFDDFVGTVVRRAVPAKARALAADVAASDIVAAVAACLPRSCTRCPPGAVRGPSVRRSVRCAANQGAR